MRRFWAALGSLLFFVIAPGTIVGLVPWSITDWQLRPAFFGFEALRLAGAALVLLGLILPVCGELLILGKSAIRHAQVVESRREGFAKGDLVQGLFGWEDYTVNGGEGLMGLQKLPRGTDPVLALSLLGTTGLTAYFGTLAVGAVKAGDTFVVSGAAGATGSVSGMIAKIKGCRVVGIAVDARNATGC